jgi:protein-S-isoprenylcysteine O-methyltransferase Ste14
MSGTFVRFGVLTVTVIAFARTAWVVAGFLRTLRRRRSMVATRWGVVELLTSPEPFVLAAVTYILVTAGPSTPPDSLLSVTGATIGAALAIGAVALTGWAFFSLPSVGSGHYVLQDQPIVDRGAYGWVRHPIYLGAFLIWLALAIAYVRLLPLVVLALYVFPMYVLYMREEERLMIERYGEAYRLYRMRVGGLLPRLRS